MPLVRLVSRLLERVSRRIILLIKPTPLLLVTTAVVALLIVLVVIAPLVAAVEVMPTTVPLTAAGVTVDLAPAVAVAVVSIAMAVAGSCIISIACASIRMPSLSPLLLLRSALVCQELLVSSGAMYTS